MMPTQRKKKGKSAAARKMDDYSPFARIDGRHPYRQAAPDGFVDYHVRHRRGGSVFFFNFDLAKEMGLLSKKHPNVLNPDLRRAVLNAFSLQVINEFDIMHKTRIPKADIQRHKYMATRYLQLQHPNKTGLTSGDGRSMWNGFFKAGNTVWDISSCGSGATCLSPAVAIEKRFFKTGDRQVAYGNGRADIFDGLCEAVMSEIFHRNGIATARILAIVAFQDGTAVNVRAHKNLLRPAHIFRYMKQGNYEALKGITDYYIDRQIRNRDWPRLPSQKKKYRYLLKYVSDSFAKATAKFESEYIFCWLDWDGDNVLLDGGIIDYGSVRQFGLYHHEYRYEDVERMSTNIIEQKAKAKHIVRTFAQITEFLITHKNRKLSHFKRHPILKDFDKTFERAKDFEILHKVGFGKKLSERIMKQKTAVRDIRDFRRIYTYFEMAKSRRGMYRVRDGITWDAIFCVRNIMRELPALYRKDIADFYRMRAKGGLSRTSRIIPDKACVVSPKRFIEILKSDYASRQDIKLNETRKRQIFKFQRCYWKLVKRAAKITRSPVSHVLKNLSQRSEIINRYERITGDAIINLSQKVLRYRDAIDSSSLYKMLTRFIEEQILRPEDFEGGDLMDVKLKNKISKKIYKAMIAIVRDDPEGI